jgi:hypothetical protein
MEGPKNLGLHVAHLLDELVVELAHLLSNLAVDLSDLAADLADLAAELIAELVQVLLSGWAGIFGHLLSLSGFKAMISLKCSAPPLALFSHVHVHRITSTLWAPLALPRTARYNVWR